MGGYDDKNRPGLDSCSPDVQTERSLQFQLVVKSSYVLMLLCFSSYEVTL